MLPGLFNQNLINPIYVNYTHISRPFNVWDNFDQIDKSVSCSFRNMFDGINWSDVLSSYAIWCIQCPWHVVDLKYLRTFVWAMGLKRPNEISLYLCTQFYDLCALKVVLFALSATTSLHLYLWRIYTNTCTLCYALLWHLVVFTVTLLRLSA